MTYCHSLDAYAFILAYCHFFSLLLFFQLIQ